MKTSRYHDAPTFNSFLQLPSKKTPPSRYSSASKNPQTMHQSMKLPVLPNNRSSVNLSYERNTKNKLKQLGDKLEEMQADLHNTRMDANETMNQMKFLKEQLLQKQLKKDHEDMRKQISGLQNLLAVTKASHEGRSNNLRENYIQLWNQTEELKQETFNLMMRIDKLDEIMGMKNI